MRMAVFTSSPGNSAEMQTGLSSRRPTDTLSSNQRHKVIPESNHDGSA